MALHTRFSWKGWGVRLVACLAIGMALAGCSGGKPTTPPPSSADELLTWYYGDKDHMIDIRIPAGYRFWGGAFMTAILGPNYPGARNTRGYVTDLYADTLWPGLPPRTPQNSREFDSPGVGRKLGIKVLAMGEGPVTQSDLDDLYFLDSRESQILRQFGSDPLTTTTKRDFHMERLLRINFLGIGLAATGSGDPNNPYLFPVEALPERFGLQRIGVNLDQHPRLLQLDPTEDQMHYRRRPDGTLQTFIRCTNDRMPDDLDNPKATYSPNCDHFFFSETLRGIVEMHYSRRYLKDWPLIEAQVNQLLNSFIVKP